MTDNNYERENNYENSLNNSYNANHQNQVNDYPHQNALSDNHSFSDEQNTHSNEAENELFQDNAHSSADATKSDKADETGYSQYKENYYSSPENDNYYADGYNGLPGQSAPLPKNEENSFNNYNAPYGYDNFRPYQSANGYTPPVNPTSTQSAAAKKQPNPKKERKSLTVRSAAVFMVICILLSGFAGIGGAYLVNKMSKSNSSGLTINQVERQSASATATSSTPDLSVAEITEKAADSVVEITTESVATGSFMQQYITSGAGSGVVISKDGYIITNNHVIENARSISVTLRNGESYDAELIGSDSTLDVAIIKIDAEGLTPAVFGDSEALKVGDTAIAIGNPLGQLGGTVTTGIISALDRDIDIDGNTMSLMQTNAAINPGNSGGGLFNGQGELIGLVVAKSSGSDVEGLGFAIPINDVSSVLKDLMEYGYVKGRIYLGLSLIDINTEQMARMYGLDSTGVYVNTVDSSSAAYKAGIQSADKITSVDGKKVSTADEIEDILDSHSVGDVVEFGLERTSRIGKKTTGTVKITLEEYVPSLSDRIGNNDIPQNGGSENYGNWDDIFGDIFDDIFG